jgi:site-specific recombinase
MCYSYGIFNDHYLHCEIMIYTPIYHLFYLFFFFYYFCYYFIHTYTTTIGTTQHLLSHILRSIPANQLAVHFHDTYGQALSNIIIALQHGVTVVDTSVSGLGGCPYAKGLLYHCSMHISSVKS